MGTTSDEDSSSPTSPADSRSPSPSSSSPLPPSKSDAVSVPPALQERYARLTALRRKMDTASALNRRDAAREMTAAGRERAQSVQDASDSHAGDGPDDTTESRKRKRRKDSERETSRERNLSYSVEDTEAWNASLEARDARRDKGFLDFAQASHRKYLRMISELKPDIASYERKKRHELALTAEGTTAHSSALITASADAIANSMPTTTATFSAEKVELMAQDVKKQVAIRDKCSRRRTFNPDEDVSYINDRNRRFNRKISRAYDKYTQEIKDSLERGTAV